jgi:hypothetical protein
MFHRGVILNVFLCFAANDTSSNSLQNKKNIFKSLYPMAQTHMKNEMKTPWSESVSELYRTSDHRLLAMLVPTFADRGWHVVNVTDPYGSVLGFLTRSRYIFFQVTPQLYSRGCVDPVPCPLLLRISGSAENRTGTSGSVSKNSGH